MIMVLVVLWLLLRLIVSPMDFVRPGKWSDRSQTKSVLCSTDTKYVLASLCSFKIYYTGFIVFIQFFVCTQEVVLSFCVYKSDFRTQSFVNFYRVWTIDWNRIRNRRGYNRGRKASGSWTSNKEHPMSFKEHNTTNNDGMIESHYMCLCISDLWTKGKDLKSNINSLPKCQSIWLCTEVKLWLSLLANRTLESGSCTFTCAVNSDIALKEWITHSFLLNPQKDHHHHNPRYEVDDCQHLW